MRRFGVFSFLIYVIFVDLAREQKGKPKKCQEQSRSDGWEFIKEEWLPLRCDHQCEMCHRWVGWTVVLMYSTVHFPVQKQNLKNH
jgi:hypothetical protein